MPEEREPAQRIKPSEIENELRQTGPLTRSQLQSRFESGRGLNGILKGLVKGGKILFRSGTFQWAQAPAASAPDRTTRTSRRGSRAKRSKEIVICVLRGNDRNHEAAPLVPVKDTRWIRLHKAKGCRVGDIVEVEVALGAVRPSGAVVRSWGGEFDASMISDIVCRASKIAVDWPEWVEKRSSVWPDPASEVSSRKDLRTLPLVTIDGEDAKDFDDAVFARSLERGWELTVAIADVSHYVEPKGELDRIARERGNSAYFADRAVPMLPESLSNGICSLKPQENRLAVVCVMKIDTNGTVSSYHFEIACIRSRARLTYGEVGRFLEQGATLDADAQVQKSLRTLHKVYKAMLSAKKRRRAISVDLPDYRPVLQDGKVVDVARSPRNDAHGLIEEAMIAANVCAGRYLEDSSVPPLYRVHPDPSEESYRELRSILALRNVEIPIQPQSRAEYLKAAQEVLRVSEGSHVFQALLIRSMQKAEYSPENVGHFGLALDQYVHFTSPIRRYPDLHTHRLIKAKVLRRPPGNTTHQQVVELGWHTSETERRAALAERVANQWLVCQLLEPRKGESFEGTIAGVQDFGVFVEIDDYGVQGLVHHSSLRPDAYVSDGYALRGTQSGKRLALADQVRVRLVNVESPTGKLDLGLVEHPLASQPRSNRRWKSR